MATFVLQTGVPIPPRVGGFQKRGSKYPFAQMEVNETFFVPSEGDKPVKSSTLRSAIGAFNKGNPGRKFAVRDVTEDGVAGVRVWRVA